MSAAHVWWWRSMAAVGLGTAGMEFRMFRVATAAYALSLVLLALGFVLALANKAFSIEGAPPPAWRTDADSVLQPAYEDDDRIAVAVVGVGFVCALALAAVDLPRLTVAAFAVGLFAVPQAEYVLVAASDQEHGLRDVLARTVDRRGGPPVGSATWWLREPARPLVVVASLVAVGAVLLPFLSLSFAAAFVAGMATFAIDRDHGESAAERFADRARTGRCTRCGRMVATEKDRCDDCSIVGSWRK